MIETETWVAEFRAQPGMTGMVWLVTTPRQQALFTEAEMERAVRRAERVLCGIPTEPTHTELLRRAYHGH